LGGLFQGNWNENTNAALFDEVAKTGCPELGKEGLSWETQFQIDDHSILSLVCPEREEGREILHNNEREREKTEILHF